MITVLICTCLNFCLYSLKEPESASHAVFPLFGSKFRYSGRTQYQSRNASKDDNRPTARVDRSASRRFAPTKPFDANGQLLSTLGVQSVQCIDLQIFNRII